MMLKWFRLMTRRFLVGYVLMYGAVVTVAAISPDVQAITKGQQSTVLKGDSNATSKIDAGLKTFLDWASYLTGVVGALTLASGAAIASPLVPGGDPRKAKEMIRSGAWIIVGAGAIWVIIEVFAKIASGLS